ncbi:HD family phosphohydrolase [Bacillus massilinigeriensis]|uniref:HD family phosphohydrolase n=1 Tax=Bacillus mediterraneensis TaxID=1805474 RepID=UPI0008F8080C|nr:HD family phosphohydrolase [Bacillus mediterraneensis]
MEKLQRLLSALLHLLKLTPIKLLLFAMLGVIMFFAMFSNVKPEKLDLSLFSVATKTIRSPVTVEDRLQTEKKRKEAVDQVEDVYILKNEYTQNRVDLLNSIFDSAKEVEEEAKAKGKEGGTASEAPSAEAMLEAYKKNLTDNVTKNISDRSLASLLAAADDEIDIAKDLAVTAVNNVMNERISADDVENAKKRVEEELKYTSLNGDLKSAVIELARYAVIQNEFYDSKATDEQRQQARDSIEPVKILEGQILVEEGQLISRDIYKQLELTGLLESENSMLPFIGLTFLVVTFLAFFYFLFPVSGSAETSQKELLIFSILFVLSLLMMKLISLLQEFDYSEMGYVFPAAMGAMLVKLLVDERAAIFHTVALSICGSIIYNQGITGALNISVSIYILAGGLSAILFLREKQHRTKILQSGLVVSLVNIFVLMSLLFIRNMHLTGGEYGIYLLAAVFSGLGSAVLAIGLLPFFEAGFGFLSRMKLIELSSPNHPLIRKILTEAPGTYHHSVMVANLAESACEAIGADGLLARVGCYYHDIGKTKRPQFFIENQMNIENPHDKLPPETSRDIIIAHAIDGGEMLRKHKMPKEIIDIAEQHHGTTLLKYFYHKAKQSGMEIVEEEYRYPGPKAQTKEIAVIGIADSVEAAVRSMSHPTSEQIEKLVKSIITDRLQDGQLNECDLTLKELETVAYSLCETLKGIFHSRIEYPEMIKQKVERA